MVNSSVFVATLNADVQERLRTSYTARDEHLKFHVFSTTEDAPEPPGWWEMALSDIWLLSYSQTLVTSPGSTFGYAAKALSGREVWVLDQIGGCRKARTHELCYQVPAGWVTCASENGVDSWAVNEIESLYGVVARCADTGGLVLVSPDA